MTQPTPDPAAPAAGLRVEPLIGRTGFQATGEVNAVNRSMWESALDASVAAAGSGALAGPVVHLDLSELTRVDAGGAAAVAASAGRLGPDGRVVLHSPPPHLPRILDVLWPRVPGIEVEP
ncbi:STAS domain-containing protein [Actinoallomurus sp. CA-142502]|uniref:STAS domain-containing protein n=1 Tax=Actinoallomurus sp. CA-142502 TaxID=3239885 RepID=UPI003D9392E9